MTFPPKTLQQQYRQTHRFFRMQMRHMTWERSLEKKQACCIVELKTLNQIRIRNKIVEKLSKRHRVWSNGSYLPGFKSSCDKDLFMKVIHNFSTPLYSNIFSMPVEIQQKMALTFYNTCQSYDWDVKVNRYKAIICIRAFELWCSLNSKFDLMIYFYLLWPIEKLKIIIDYTHNMTFKYQEQVISITQIIKSEHLDYCVLKIYHNQVVLDYNFLFNSTNCASNPSAIQTQFECVMNRFPRIILKK